MSGIPLELVNAVTKRRDLEDVNFYSGLLLTLPDFLLDETETRFTLTYLFMGPVERMFMEWGIIEPFSVHFSKLDTAIHNFHPRTSILEVSPPDSEGRMSIGPGNSLFAWKPFLKIKNIFV